MNYFDREYRAIKCAFNSFASNAAFRQCCLHSLRIISEAGTVDWPRMKGPKQYTVLPSLESFALHQEYSASFLHKFLLKVATRFAKSFFSSWTSEIRSWSYTDRMRYSDWHLFLLIYTDMLKYLDCTMWHTCIGLLHRFLYEKAMPQRV